MRKATPSIKHIRRDRRFALRIIAAIICLSLIAFSFVSTAFILTNAKHAHDHRGAEGSCSTCAQVSAAEKLLRQMTALVACLLLGVAGIFTFKSETQHYVYRCVNSSLVQLKVQFNN